MFIFPNIWDHPKPIDELHHVSEGYRSTTNQFSIDFRPWTQGPVFMGWESSESSGGWKMKMQLCAAQLMNADVLMLDEAWPSPAQAQRKPSASPAQAQRKGAWWVVSHDGEIWGV